MSPIEVAWGFVVTIILALLAFRLKALDRSGLLTSLLIGFTIFLGGGSRGWAWLTVVLSFFALSVVFTKYRYDYKKQIGVAQEKGGMRSWPNSLANGGVAAVAAALEGFSPGDLYVAAYLGAIATATSDTLATEIGLLSKAHPRLLVSPWRKVSAGVSGAVTPLGLLASVFGGAFIGIVSLASGLATWSAFRVLSASVTGGALGSLFDSVLGGSLQGINRCVVCRSSTENLKHCGRSTQRVRGYRFIENNVVNFLSTLFGSFIAILVFVLTI